MITRSSRPRRSARVLVVMAVGASLALAGCGGDAKVEADAVPTTIDIAENPNGGSFRLLTYNVSG